MANNNLDGFDAEKVEPSTNFDPVPAGLYLVMAVDSEFKPTAKKDGEYLQFVLEIVDGPHRGRRLFDRLNLKNNNETAVKIARATLSAICRAVGVMRPRDSSELHGKPMAIKVDVEERNDKPGAFNNRIKDYEPANGASAAPAPTAAAAGVQPPWKRKSA